MKIGDYRAGPLSLGVPLCLLCCSGKAHKDWAAPRFEGFHYDGQQVSLEVPFDLTWLRLSVLTVLRLPVASADLA